MVRLRFREALSAARCLFVPKWAICFGVMFRRVRFFPTLRGLLASRVVLTTLIDSSSRISYRA